jgi:hypothetical protein
VGSIQPLSANACTAITDTHGRILMASDNLIALVGDPDPNGLYGKSLGQLVDRAEGLLAQVLRDGLTQLSSALLCGHGTLRKADIVATLINDGDQERIGFCLQLHEASEDHSLADALQKLLSTERKQPLDDLLQQVQALTEHHAIGNALRGSGANLAASARMLGINATDLAERMARLGMKLAPYTNH